MTDEVIKIPDGGYATYRRPDLYSKQHGLVIELDGEGVHGFGDILREKDIRQNEDYKLAGVQVIRINSAQTEGYREDLVVETLKKRGLKPL